MKNTLILLILTFSIIKGGAQNIEKLSNFENHDFESLFFITSTKPFIVDLLKINTEEQVPYDEFYKLEKINKSDLLLELSNYMDTFTNAEKNSIIDSMLVWKNMTNIINFPFELDSTNLTEFHEIIANIKTTEYLVNKHIYTKEQYYGSLSTSQVNFVYYDLMNYLFHLSSIEKLDFFKSYFEMAYSIGKN